MDASRMYTKGFHPTSKFLEVNAMYEAKYVSRSKAKSVKYLYIDFEMSRLITSEDDRHMQIQQGPSELAPEIENGQIYDPFLADVYYLGGVYEKHLLHVRVIPFSKCVTLTSVQEIYESGISSTSNRVHGSRRSKGPALCRSSPRTVH